MSLDKKGSLGYIGSMIQEKVAQVTMSGVDLSTLSPYDSDNPTKNQETLAYVLLANIEAQALANFDMRQADESIGRTIERSKIDEDTELPYDEISARTPIKLIFGGKDASVSYGDA